MTDNDTLSISPPVSTTGDFIRIHELKPLDLGLVDGAGVVSSFIKGLEKLCLGVGTFSHMFMVVDRTILNLPELVPGKLYTLEITMSGILNDGVKDIEGKSHLGVQVRDLTEVCKAQIKMGSKIYFSKLSNSPYRDGYVWRYSNFNLIQTYRDNLAKAMLNIYQTYKGMGYNFNVKSLIFKPFFGFKKQVNDEGVFCSELVAIIYSRLGISNVAEPRDIVPATILAKAATNLSFIDCFERPMKLYYKKY